MAKSIKQLTKELNKINDITQDFTEEMEIIYQDYFTNLVEIINRQLLQATYQICTQKYPHAFLKLRYQERLNLQNNIKQLKGSFAQILTGILEDYELKDSKQLVCLKNKIFQCLPIKGDISPSLPSNPDVTKDANIITSDDELSFFNPDILIKFIDNIDNAIAQSLIKISLKTNKLLQQSEILPKEIPNKILEMALEAEENTSLISGAPNLLSLLVEKENSPEENKITPIVAICLRIREIEFNDPLLSSLRQKITKILRDLHRLNEEYQFHSQQYAIAQAEVAWRGSWFEDN